MTRQSTIIATALVLITGSSSAQPLGEEFARVRSFLVAGSDQPGPGLDGVPFGEGFVSSHDVRDSGVVVFRTTAGGGFANQALWIQRKGTISLIARGADLSPLGEPFVSLSVGSISESGQLILSSRADSSFVDFWLWDEGTITPLALSGTRLNGDSGPVIAFATNPTTFGTDYQILGIATEQDGRFVSTVYARSNGGDFEPLLQQGDIVGGQVLSRLGSQSPSVDPYAPGSFIGIGEFETDDNGTAVALYRVTPESSSIIARIDGAAPGTNGAIFDPQQQFLRRVTQPTANGAFLLTAATTGPCSDCLIGTGL